MVNKALKNLSEMFPRWYSSDVSGFPSYLQYLLNIYDISVFQKLKNLNFNGLFKFIFLQILSKQKLIIDILFWIQ